LKVVVLKRVMIWKRDFGEIITHEAQNLFIRDLLTKR